MSVLDYWINKCLQTFQISINGLIQISYANTQSNNEENPDTIYGRQLVYPVLITVYQMLECQALNISSLTSINTQGDLNGSSWGKTLQGTTTEEWCLLSVHVLNSYNLPFEVTLSYKTGMITKLVTGVILTLHRCR